MNSLAVAFTGPSNSGKTTLIVKLSNLLKDKYKVAIIKHDPKDKAKFDVEGKDSDKFTKTGADVAVISPKKTTLFLHQENTLDSVIDMLMPFDILLVEGLKELNLPRIAIFREKIDEKYIPYSNAIAIDDSIDLNDYDIPKNCDILDLNNTMSIAKWILNNAKIVKQGS